MKLIFIFLAIVLTAFFINYYPHYYAYKHTPAGYVFSGQASWFDPWDINNYFAAIRWAQINKSFLVENWNTTEAVPKTFIYPLYTAAGILFPAANPIKIYWALAIISGIILCLTIFIVSYWFLPNKKLALVALFLTVLGGGLGGADINIPGVTLFSAFQKPHEALAFIFFIFALGFFWRSGFVSILFLILLIPFYPYRLLIWFLICGVYLLIRGGNKIIYFLGLTTGGILGILYVLHFLTSGFSVLTSYKPVSISVFSLILGYGIFGIFFIVQFFLKLKNSNERLFLNIWCLITLSLSFLPGMGRLFLAGTIFPLILICLLTYKEISEHFKVSSLGILIVILLLAPLSSFFIFNKRIEEVKNLNMWYYLPQNMSEKLSVLRSLPDGGVLALPPWNSYVPAWTGKKVYFGHQDQTPGIIERQEKAIRFYKKDFTEAETQNFLKENNIDYIFYGP